MIDEQFLNSLSTPEKESFKQGLEALINQTYVIEEEYKTLNESYLSLQTFIRQIVETLPNALWVLDVSGEIFLQNSEAEANAGLLEHIDTTQGHHEVEFNEATYLIKIVQKGDKTIISATDITGEKRKERLASMGQVAAHLSHEIRNPIGSISLLTSTLFKKVDIATKPIVLEMKKAIWRVERIIKATLLFSKGIQPSMGSFFLDELGAECEEALSHYTYTKEIALKVDLPHLAYQGDKDLLSLVFQNLLFNAIDAIEEDDNDTGTITLSYVKEGEFHCLDMHDSGKPIENSNILFEPFKTTKTKGNGLGLALSLQIIQAHEGLITLQENPKAFRILLP
ncbi:sensor histidine kinase [Sulfurospirillum tamanense]|uniref:sensor histidine kinase n=1 Tax=Sulfurospirillum tamanense TaxID=2813362 RepID=UPI001F078DCD|nr:ATP-binding protein [Sulfurospirillum tamanensis]